MDSAMHAPPPPDSEAIVLCASEDVRDLMTYWLASLQIRAAVNPDGDHANRIVQERRCRLLVTDRILPPWPGLNTFLQLRAANPRLRIAYVANGDIHAAKLAWISGVTDVLERPLTRKALIDALDRVEARA